MLEDTVRTHAYRDAIKELVSPGDVVVDIGTGTGILALFACQANARRVYAIEKSSVIKMARSLSQRNKFDERIAFINKLSTEVELSEKVDLVVTEILGTFALDENILRYIIDSRDRFLKPDGKLIPSGIKLFLAAVESPEAYKYVSFWDKHLYKLDLEPARVEAAKTPYEFSFDSSECICEPIMIYNYDLYDTNQTEFEEVCSFTIKRNGIMHGWAGWFEVLLSPNISISTAPEMPQTHWKQIYFPSIVPIRVIKGETVKLRIKAISKENATFWGWQHI